MFGYLIPTGAGDPISLAKPEIEIGRHKSCGIVLNYSNVSGKHCKLVMSEGYWYVVDLQSTNGIKVNGNKVRDRRLDSGDLLSVAKHEFKIQYDPKMNGATGLPPANSLAGDDVFSQSLMQRAGLEKAKAPVEPEPTEEEKIIETDITASIRQPHRDFLSELVFD